MCFLDFDIKKQAVNVDLTTFTTSKKKLCFMILAFFQVQVFQF